MENKSLGEGENTERLGEIDRQETVQGVELSQRLKDKKRRKAFAGRMSEIIPGLFLGNVQASCNREMLQENQINAIVSLSERRCARWSSITRNAGVPECRHLWIQCADSSMQEPPVRLSEICDFIDQMAAPALRSSTRLPTQHAEASVKPNDRPYEAVLVHCEFGVPRSPTVIVAYLMRKYKVRREDALAFVQSKQRVRPSDNSPGNCKFGKKSDIRCGRTMTRPFRRRRIKHS